MRTQKNFKTLLSKLIPLTIITLLICSCDNPNHSSTTVTIGTCEVMDLVNPTGEILTRIINTDIVRNDVVAKVIETKGSGENISMLLNNKLSCGLANSISSEMAFKGEKSYKNYPNRSELRSICSFYIESIIFIVRADSGIKDFADIKGKKIGIAAAESASIGDISKYIKQFYNITIKDFTRLPYGLEKSVLALEKGEIDGFLFVTAQPSPYIMGLTNTKDFKCCFIQFSKKMMEYVKVKIPSLTYTQIPAEMYPNSINQTAITTLGTRILLLTMDDMDEDTVYYLTKEICTYFPEYDSVHPSFKTVTPESMAKNLILPVHPGALKYYKEAGLAKYIPKKLLPKFKK